MGLRILYPNIKYGANGLVVEQLLSNDRPELQRLVPGIIDLTERAYSRQMEAPLGPLAPGTIAAHYTTEKRQEATLARIHRVFAEPGAYFVVRSPENPDKLDALLNVADGSFYNLETGKEEEWSYFFDILADPPRKRLGSAVLHAAVTQGGRYHWEGRLDAYRGSSVNTWYENIGFQNSGPASIVEVAGVSIPTDRYEVEKTQTVLTNLERRHPELQHRQALQ